MSESKEARYRAVMSGSDRSPRAALLRAASAAIEPFYAAAMHARNALFDRGFLPSHDLHRPTISVGNITTGGTGKTPVVQWLAENLASAGEQPVVLMRGYKTTAGGISDEQAELTAAGARVLANPNRVAAAAGALAKYPQTSVFLLDDAMQHRRARRDFELVLIHAAQPFGYGRVFPRGLLRESLSGLRRATAILITHAGEADANAIEQQIRRFTAAPIFHCDHRLAGFFTPQDQPADLSGKKCFAFCGIGSPESFFRQLAPIATRAFDDHHDYNADDIAAINRAASAAGAEALVTTMKDWVKLKPVAAGFALPISHARLSLQFRSGDDQKLLELIRAHLATARAGSSNAARISASSAAEKE